MFNIEWCFLYRIHVYSDKTVFFCTNTNDVSYVWIEENYSISCIQVLLLLPSGILWEKESRFWLFFSKVRIVNNRHYECMIFCFFSSCFPTCIKNLFGFSGCTNWIHARFEREECYFRLKSRKWLNQVGLNWVDNYFATIKTRVIK